MGINVQKKSVAKETNSNIIIIKVNSKQIQ